jgi:Fic family protein
MSASSWSPTRPYNDLPPIPGASILETKAVLKACVEARAALAGLKQGAELIPNQSMLINTLPVLEAQASSAIENIVTTADKLFANLHAEGRTDPATKEALRYRRSLMEGFKTLRKYPVSTRMAEKICTRIKEVDMRVRRVPGTKLANASTGEIFYTPPEGEDVIRRHLAAWERFLHAERELDPVIRMAAGHYQFEAIHPFTDGNGRTGRVINSLFLIQEELLTLPILYLSRFIIKHKEQYYGLLIDVTRNETWEPWLLFMLAGVKETAEWTLRKILAIRDLEARTAEHIRAELPRIYSRELVDVIHEQPYCRIANVVDAGLAKRQTASTHLKCLVGLGVLEERRSGREKLFVNKGLLEVLMRED